MHTRNRAKVRKLDPAQSLMRSMTPPALPVRLEHAWHLVGACASDAGGPPISASPALAATGGPGSKLRLSRAAQEDISAYRRPRLSRRRAGDEKHFGVEGVCDALQSACRRASRAALDPADVCLAHATALG